MPKSSMLMIHNAWTCAAGNAKELRKIADDLDIMSETIAQSYMEKSNGKITQEKLREMLDAETYIKAEECLALGLCDSLGEEDDTEEKAKAAVQNSMRSAMIKAQAMHNVKALAEDPETPESEPEQEAPEQESSADPEPTVAENETVEPNNDANAESIADTFMKIFTRKAV